MHTEHCQSIEQISFAIAMLQSVSLTLLGQDKITVYHMFRIKGFAYSPSVANVLRYEQSSLCLIFGACEIFTKRIRFDIQTIAFSLYVQ